MTGTVLAVDRGVTVSTLRAAPALVERGVTREVHRGGHLLQTAVRAKASGRPGPRVQVGDYRRGISLDVGSAIGGLGALVPFATVYSESPQAQRLENGFIGTDSLGRSYHQPAYPHWDPATKQVEPIIVRRIDDVLDLIDRGVA